MKTTLLYYSMLLLEYPMEWSARLHEWVRDKWETEVNQYWAEHPEELKKITEKIMREFS